MIYTNACLFSDTKKAYQRYLSMKVNIVNPLDIYYQYFDYQELLRLIIKRGQLANYHYYLNKDVLEVR